MTKNKDQVMAECTVDEWQNCYNDGWRDLIVPEAFAHPAKISYSLAARIYDHAFERGWLKANDVCCDPFGGIGGTGLHAAIRGVRWIGCELEPKFHELANANIDLWQRKYGHCQEWVRPVIHCGDSRRLAEVLGAADLFSPGQLGSMREGDIDAVLSSPPYAQSALNDSQRTIHQSGLQPGCNEGDGGTYGKSTGQLGAMPEGNADAVVSSPPFAGQQTGGGIAAANGINGNVKTGENCGYQNQGESPGQLSAMIVGSPPYEGDVIRNRYADVEAERVAAKDLTHKCGLNPNGRPFDAYGQTTGNIGNDSGETFWSASATIISQCHAILRPGGVCIWVTKRFVRNGKIVEFSDQWLALCESLGFRLICRHRAMLVKRGGTQKLLDGGEHTREKSRKSFFRRLAERRGSPRIDWEDVLCVEKSP